MALSPTLSRRHAPLSGRRILVVEDEYFLADDISRALRSAGAEIAGPVGELDDALPIINDGGILDGAVLDVNIRSEMVFPIAQELRARQVPFVFTTGYDRVSIAPQFHDVVLLEKPIDIAAMVRGLAGLIGKPKA
ncbi:response regulator [Bradyrhizobium sp. CCBAU 45389]|uniref:response regulator n=1 Tax=Bradyrhizobium sp. CCBAU 45389 TaxID=858429 RepID=UPI002305F943|nr:response regulator [Bradyrhizobium sp. CCBAU 45389]MDA9401579.1 chemotaxis protein CheY [Bradyrhizobium sp. CCBAU 45389]